MTLYVMSADNVAAPQREPPKLGCNRGGVNFWAENLQYLLNVAGLPWRINRKLHTRFRFVLKSMTLDDLQRPVSKRMFSESATKTVQIEAHNQWRKCRRIILISDSIRFVRILFSFQAFSWLFLGKFHMITQDTQSLVGFSVITKLLTLNDSE